MLNDRFMQKIAALPSTEAIKEFATENAGSIGTVVGSTLAGALIEKILTKKFGWKGALAGAGASLAGVGAYKALKGSEPTASATDVNWDPEAHARFSGIAKLQAELERARQERAGVANDYMNRFVANPKPSYPLPEALSKDTFDDMANYAPAAEGAEANEFVVPDATASPERALSPVDEILARNGMREKSSPQKIVITRKPVERELPI